VLFSLPGAGRIRLRGGTVPPHTGRFSRDAGFVVEGAGSRVLEVETVVAQRCWKDLVPEEVPEGPWAGRSSSAALFLRVDRLKAHASRDHTLAGPLWGDHA